MKRYGLVILAPVLLSGCSLVRGKPEPSPTPAPEAKVERRFTYAPANPVVRLVPRADGNALVVRVDKAKAYRRIEAQIVYRTAEGTSQGFLKTLRPGGENMVESKEGLFGTCSSGICRYDEDVVGGTMEVGFVNRQGREKIWQASFDLFLFGEEREVEIPGAVLTVESAELSGMPVVVHPLLGLPEHEKIGSTADVKEGSAYYVGLPAGVSGEATVRMVADQLNGSSGAVWIFTDAGWEAESVAGGRELTVALPAVIWLPTE